MAAATDLGLRVGLKAACRAFSLNRAFLYRERLRARPTVVHSVVRVRVRPPLAFCAAEQALLLALLNSERFADLGPAAVFAILLDEGRYHGSIRTMYRLLAACHLTGERRSQRVHPAYIKPQLLSVRPNQIWSWDITKLNGPATWTCFHLFVIIDIFSRYVVGWMLATRESAELAEQLISDTVLKHDIAPGTLTLHADRGSSMRSKPRRRLTHRSGCRSYSEAQFKTLKYRPEFPDRFGSIEDARAHCRQFFQWYNHVHRHSGIALMTRRCTSRRR